MLVLRPIRGKSGLCMLLAFASFALGGCGGPAEDVGSNATSALGESCNYDKGMTARQTLANLPSSIPLKHIIIVMQENRSFDHMLGSLALEGKDVDGVPADFVNPDRNGDPVNFWHRTDTCFDADSPHNEEALESSVDGDRMDTFVESAATDKNDGHYVMSYYTRAELPFYYYLTDSFATSDRYFSAMLGPTDPNRDFLYAATSNGVNYTQSGSSDKPMKGVKTIYNLLDEHHVSWGVYSSGQPRQGALGWTCGHKGFHSDEDFFDALRDDKLPSVVFVDPGEGQDEHPPHDVQKGEKFAKKIFEAVTSSKAWSSTALFFTYDEGGGIADHVSPPAACAPSPEFPSFNRLGERVPVILVSPFAKPGYVSHETHSHTSLLRLIEATWDLPALTARDANSDAMLDMFDFGRSPYNCPGAGPLPGRGGCVNDPTDTFLNKVGSWFGNTWTNASNGCF